MPWEIKKATLICPSFFQSVFRNSLHLEGKGKETEQRAEKERKEGRGGKRKEGRGGKRSEKRRGKEGGRERGGNEG